MIPEALHGARVDRALASLFDLSVNATRRLIEKNRVRIDGKRVKKGDVVARGAVVFLEGTGEWLVPAQPAEAVSVLFADARVIVVEKPAGMACHPLVPGEGGTVVDALALSYPEIKTATDEPREGGLVHRLDTGTS